MMKISKKNMDNLYNMQGSLKLNAIKRAANRMINDYSWIVLILCFIIILCSKFIINFYARSLTIFAFTPAQLLTIRCFCISFLIIWFLCCCLSEIFFLKRRLFSLKGHAHSSWFPLHQLHYLGSYILFIHIFFLIIQIYLKTIFDIQKL